MPALEMSHSCLPYIHVYLGGGCGCGNNLSLRWNSWALKKGRTLYIYIYNRINLPERNPSESERSSTKLLEETGYRVSD